VSEHIDDQNREGARGRGDSSGRYAECAYVDDLAAGYALGALESDDQQRINDHITACKSCDQVITQAMQTVAMLPFTTVSATPPLHAKAELFARIAQSSRLQTANAPSPTVTIPASNAETTNVPPPPRRWKLPPFGRGDASPRARINFPLLATPLATVPLVIALAVLGSFAMSSQSKVSDLRAELLSARTDLNDASEAFDAVDNFKASDDAKVYELPAQGGTDEGGVHGKVIANPGTTEAMLMIWRLDNEPKDCRYEVLLENKDGGMVRVAEFGVDSEGHGAAKLSLAQPFNDYVMLRIKRKYADPNVVGTQIPSNDALIAKIGPGSTQVFDRVATTTK
jgi:hypothetical protein